MASKRWEQQVLRYIGSSDLLDTINGHDAVKLLARQHAAVVRMVKKIGNNATTSQFSTSNECMAWKMACADILAALATHRKGRT